MIDWIIGIIIAAAVITIIVKKIKAIKSGNTGCSGCSGCGSKTKEHHDCNCNNK